MEAINIKSIKIDGIDSKDFPDFCDAYISYAEFDNGIELTEDELEKYQEENESIVCELIHENQLYI